MNSEHIVASANVISICMTDHHAVVQGIGEELGRRGGL